MISIDLIQSAAKTMFQCLSIRKNPWNYYVIDSSSENWFGMYKYVVGGKSAQLISFWLAE